MKSLKELFEERNAIVAKAEQYEAAHRDHWGPTQHVEMDAMVAKAKGLTKEIQSRQSALDEAARSGNYTPVEGGQGPGFIDFRNSSGVGRNSGGVTFLGKSDSAVRALGGVANGLGDFIRSMVLGNASGASPQVQAALSGGAGASGGYAVPTELASGVLDLARSKSVLTQAGMGMAVMNHSEMSMIRLTSDPEFQVKAENALAEESTLTIGAQVFRPFLVMTYLTLSRELVEDSVGFSPIVEDILSRSLAAQLDRIPLRGTPAGASSRAGMVDDPAITEVASVGSMTWQKLSNAATSIRSDNHEPGACIMNPVTRDGLLTSTASGSGEWLSAPPSLANVQMLDTTALEASTALIGDFTKAVWAFRSGPVIESTTTGGDTFRRHQNAIKITWRGDFGLTYPKAIRRLTGIS
jgi:HK97 family phage major capsid protein